MSFIYPNVTDIFNGLLSTYIEKILDFIGTSNSVSGRTFLCLHLFVWSCVYQAVRFWLSPNILSEPV